MTGNGGHGGADQEKTGRFVFEYELGEYFWRFQTEKEIIDTMPEKCRINVRKMSKNCPKGLKTQFSDIFWTIFAHLVDTFVLGNGRNTVSRVLFRRRELTEFYSKLGEFCDKLGEFALAHK